VAHQEAAFLVEPAHQELRRLDRELAKVVDTPQPGTPANQVVEWIAAPKVTALVVGLY
jgi:hypothetical protein